MSFAAEAWAFVMCAGWIGLDRDATEHHAMASFEPSLTLSEEATPPVASRRKRLLAALFKRTLKFVALVFVLTAARASLADQYHVPTGSMWPTIEPGDRIFVAKAAYGLRVPFTDAWLFHHRSPRPGEVVVFADPRGGAIPLVKRVVATEGQTVAVKRGILYIDGRPQRIERLPDGRFLEHLGGLAHESGGRDFEDFGPAVVPRDHLFVMGDNRPASLDSRVMGTVPSTLVRGQVLGVMFRGEGLDFERVFRAIR
ncbi:signal peptidase I [Polyangium mundeleinium]|uniref:Signal peptidase I n=1 Tax=Polyangium mundeleinium TaxID=2995306 RepID=A0ABT5EI63_9BACT|nr:signal peptidase I [Polyangium mundeleinium]MDC0741510.1 signal peptidase I [Polyangium mundeleinium]